jgi:HEAT repeat protein
MRVFVSTALLTAALSGRPLLAASLPPILAGDDQSSARPAAAGEQSLYQAGTAALDRSDWAAAADAFARCVALRGARTDGALYWLAYAQNKGGRRAEALRTLTELRTQFPDSKWNKEGSALALEVRHAAGETPAPEAQADNDLKLMAISGLMNADPKRALPLLDQLIRTNRDPKLRDRAMFVLAQSGSPEANAAVQRFATNDADPETQSAAINYLGVSGRRDVLGDLYTKTSNESAKRSVLNALMVAGDRERLGQIARTEANLELRRHAIRQLGVSGGGAELWQMYRTDAPLEIKKEILNGLFVGGQADRLGELAQSEKNPELRREAIQKLGLFGADHTGSQLAKLYASDSDPEVKRTILHAFFVQGNSSALIAIARAEKDQGLRKTAVQQLSLMGSKDAVDYMLELLK